MGFTQDYESFRAERLHLLVLERDPDVLECFAQAPPIRLEYTTQHGKRRVNKSDHKADVLVLRKTRVELVEVKPKSVLQKSFEDGSTRFALVEGRWTSPPGEAWATPRGLHYIVWSPEDVPGLLPQNFDFLDPLVKMPLNEIYPGDVASILRPVAETPGITLQDLESQLTKSQALAVQWLIGNNLLYCDLERTLLAEKHRAQLFIDQPTARIFEAVGGGSRGGENSGVAPQGKNSLVTERLRNLAPQYRELMVQRLEWSKDGLKDWPVSDRHRRRMKRRMRVEERAGNSPLMGLLPSVSARGNYNRRIPKEVEDAVRGIINEKYASQASPVPIQVWHLARTDLKKRGLYVPGTKWFYKFLPTVRTLAMEEERRGTKAVYFDAFVGTGIAGVSDTAGAHPFDRVHIDHTQLEITVIDEESGMCLERPWLSLMIDAYTGHVVAHYLSFSHPSVDSLIMIFRKLVHRYQTIPFKVVSDNGTEFYSTWYELLLASTRAELVRRPPSKPRFGAIVERMFGIINSTLLYSLLGNTQRLRRARELMAKDHPKKDAIWTLAALEEALDGLVKLRGERLIPHLGRSAVVCIDSYLKDDPRSALRYQKYDHDFYLRTLLESPKGTVRVQRGYGVKFRGVYYSNFELEHMANADLRMLYDPEDVGTIQLSIDGHWVPAESKHREKLQYYSFRELARFSKIFSRRWLESQKFNIDKEDQIAAFVDSIQEEEKVKIQKMRNLATKRAVPKEILSESSQAGLRDKEAKLATLRQGEAAGAKTQSSDDGFYNLINGKNYEGVTTSTKNSE